MINLNYYFGCGGFYALWILLLGSDLKCSFDDKRSLEELYQDQWNIKNISNWKSSEIWPNNKSGDLSFYCNTLREEWDKQVGKKIVLYTDIQTQFTLGKTKRAGFWFEEPTPELTCMLKIYNDIRAEHWPQCNTWQDLKNLEQYQKDEIQQIDFDKSLFKNFVDFNTFDYKGEKIFSGFKNIIDINQADHFVKLQDIIKSNGQILLEPLGYSTNEKCKEFTEHYINLHTEETRKLIT